MNIVFVSFLIVGIIIIGLLVERIIYYTVAGVKGYGLEDCPKCNRKTIQARIHHKREYTEQSSGHDYWDWYCSICGSSWQDVAKTTREKSVK